MKINQKLYAIAEGTEPVVKQTFDDRFIEIYFMDQFEGLVEEYVHSKGQFAVWTSADAVNYRLFIERGYYNEVKELYDQPVNKIWVEFWDRTDVLSKKFTRIFIYPMMLLAVVLCVLSFVLPRVFAWEQQTSNIFSYCIIGGLVLLFIVMMLCNSFTKKKITQENVKSRQLVIDIFGKENFDQLLDKQKNYMDEYFKNLYPEEPEEFNSEEAPEEAKTEEVEALEETTDTNEETVAEEVVEEKAEEAPVEEAASEEKEVEKETDDATLEK